MGATSQISGKGNETDQQQMDNDLAERDAFVARLLEKEEIRTRKEQVLKRMKTISYLVSCSLFW